MYDGLPQQPREADGAGAQAGAADPACAAAPPSDAAERLTTLLGARNPFLSVAGPLLRAIADMPQTLDPAGMQALRLLLEEEVRLFTRLCDQANLRRDHMLAVRYALCTAVDEAASLKPWGGGTADSTGPWSKHALLQTFHQEGNGGRRVFLLIGRLAANPQEHLQVLEVMLHVLGLGFMGHYRTQSDGYRMVETIRNRLHALVTGARDALARELSPRWQGLQTGRLRPLRGVPVWLSAGLLVLALLGLFAWQKVHLVAQAQAVEQRIRDIGRLMPAPQRLRLRELLAQEIAAGRVGVDEDGLRSQVTFRGDDMFAAGRAELNPRMLPMLEKVAAGINEVQGRVEVVGHTDNQPIATPAFPSNQVLSEKRAQAVARMLGQHQVDPARVGTAGMGERQPVADNAGAAGRARNRRVEITVLSQ